MTQIDASRAEASLQKMTWQGAPKVVNLRKAFILGPWFVAEYRLRNMSKWIAAIIAFGIGNPLLYLLSVGLGVGALVDANTGPSGVDGVSYLTFLAPALLASATIQGAMDETSFPTLQGFVWDKSFFGMNSTQLSGRAIVWGVMIAAGVRCLLTAFLYEGILLAFGSITWASIPSLTLASFFAGMAFAAVMLAGISFVKQDDGVFAIVGRFIIAPMFMFSGTFFPLTALPIYLQWIGWISPVWHATNLGRALSYGMPLEPWLAVVHVVYLLVMLVAGMWVGSWQFARRLAQ